MSTTLNEDEAVEAMRLTGTVTVAPFTRPGLLGPSFTATWSSPGYPRCPSRSRSVGAGSEWGALLCLAYWWAEERGLEVTP